MGLYSINDKTLLHRFIHSNDVQTQDLRNGITAVHAAHFLGLTKKLFKNAIKKGRAI